MSISETLIAAQPADPDVARFARQRLPRSMSWRFRLASVVLLVSTLIAGDRTAGAADRPPPQPPITIDALLPSWRARVEWAVGRFAMAGLPLPPMEITVHRHTRLCEGNGGLYRPGPPVEVHICSTGDADTNAARLIILHELGHAWAEAHLEPSVREEFLELRGLDAWVDPDRPPNMWGAEHAAEVVSWGLMDAQLELIRIPDTDPSLLRNAFELLVDQSPLWTDAAN